MRHIQLKVPALIGDTYHPAGALVEVDDHRAAVLVQLGHAQFAQPIAVEHTGSTAQAKAEKAVTRK